jgi:hypothetical protein
MKRFWMFKQMIPLCIKGLRLRSSGISRRVYLVDRWKLSKRPPKRWYPCTKLYGVIFQKTIILIPPWKLKSHKHSIRTVKITTCFASINEQLRNHSSEFLKISVSTKIPDGIRLAISGLKLIYTYIYVFFFSLVTVNDLITVVVFDLVR